MEAQKGNSSDIRRFETEVGSANASNTFTSHLMEDFNDVPSNQGDFDHSTIDPSVRPSKKVAEVIGFTSRIYSCLDYLKVIFWVREEEEEKVVASVLCLHKEIAGVNPVLKRVSSKVSKPPKSLFCKFVMAKQEIEMFVCNLRFFFRYPLNHTGDIGTVQVITKAGRQFLPLKRIVDQSNSF
ncbi:hypothetical protein Ancab_011434 [Ancistrocladus abbreviatus]